MQIFELTGHDLTIKDVVMIAQDTNITVTIASQARKKMQKSRSFVEEAVNSKKVIYGLTTGFGYFKKITIDQSQTEKLQHNLIVSHAVGVGPALSREEVRAMILVRANSLIKGYSGIRVEVVEQLLELINKNIYPYVPEIGSLGASGDLAPLAHMTLVLMGLGEAFHDGKRISGKEALTIANLKPVRLLSKEGLALTNGTSMMCALACLNVMRAERIIKIADIAGAMAIEGLMGSLKPFHPKIHTIRGHEGQISCARNIRSLCRESEIIKSHKNCNRIQDSYSLRCIPQVHGAIRDTLAHVRMVIAKEINAATDNPLIFPEENVSISAGNFHGEPIAFAMDFLSIAIAELGSLSERRIAKSLDAANNEGLPAFLIPKKHAGVSSGFMILQYTAAALVSENKTLAHPDSVDSIPTSANQEDHVSMGAAAARHARNIVTNVEHILAIELLTQTQAIDFRKPNKPGHGTNAAHTLIRQIVPFLEEDRILYPDIHKIRELISNNKLLSVVEHTVGKLET